MNIQDLVFIILGLLGLFVGGEWLVRSASRLATSFGVSAIVIGLTIIALGTSMPELLVGISASAKGESAILVGNVLGSNIANVGLILGIAGLIYPLVVHKSFLAREIPAMMLVYVIFLLMCLDGSLGRIEGVLLVLGYLAFTYILYRQTKRENAEKEELEEEVESIEGDGKPIRRSIEILSVILSLFVLIAGAQLTVEGAVNIARAFGVSEFLIGLTLVAVGTSLPELTTSSIAAYHKHSDIALGNVVGSSITNLLVIMGVSAILQPISLDMNSVGLSFAVMIFFGALLWIFVLNQVLARWQAASLLVLYLVYVIAAFAMSNPV